MRNMDRGEVKALVETLQGVKVLEVRDLFGMWEIMLTIDDGNGEKVSEEAAKTPTDTK